jgi:prevent-host-death family protein
MVMIKVNVFEVKARLSEYLDRAARGERVVVCRHNRPVAELRSVSAVRTEPRPIGPVPGRPAFDVPPSFFEPMTEEELEIWEGTTPTYSSPRSSSSGATRVAERHGTPPGKQKSGRRDRSRTPRRRRP